PAAWRAGSVSTSRGRARSTGATGPRTGEGSARCTTTAGAGPGARTASAVRTSGPRHTARAARVVGAPWSWIRSAPLSRLEHGIDASVASVGDADDNALAESQIRLCKAELIHREGPWKGRDQVE